MTKDEIRTLLSSVLDVDEVEEGVGRLSQNLGYGKIQFAEKLIRRSRDGRNVEGNRVSRPAGVS